ncbi:MAG TPA: chromosome partitioning protein ParB [Gammaproteobacteria bacterium]|jgi:ParB family chromosome partitioning protein|nr:chromosome partitioning protein ParB [Gammaproteobacteria bacterium]
MSKSKKRGLGRGLDALLGGADTAVLDAEPEASESSVSTGTAVVADDGQLASDNVPDRKGLKQVAIDQIQRGSYQPRRHFEPEALQELADSLSTQGMVQPVVLRPRAEGYELIAGERRWRAAQLAGMATIPAVVREYSDADAAAVALIENIQREDLNPLEEAAALQRLQAEFGMSHKAVAEAVGRSRTAVTNLLRLLDLHDDVKKMVDERSLDMGHARALLGADLADQYTLAKMVVDRGLSVRATEALVKNYRSGASSRQETKATMTKDPDIQALELRLSDTLGSQVLFKHKPNGGGKLEISYASLDELEGILEHIR